MSAAITFILNRVVLTEGIISPAGYMGEEVLKVVRQYYQDSYGLIR